MEEEHVFLGPIVATPLAAEVHSVLCKEKALLDVSISLSNEGVQSRVVCKIDSGAETNILPMSMYQQLKHKSHKLSKPTMKLTAYGRADLPNLGSCFVFVEVPGIQKLWKMQVQVVGVDGPMIIGNKSAQNLGLGFGKKVVIETDHKPLESIWKKSITSASPRLQRLLLRMSKYNVDLRYIQGKKNVIADALSRVSCM